MADDRTIKTYHEAGHSVVAYDLGLPVESVSVVGNDRCYGHSRSPLPDDFHEYGEDSHKVMEKHLMQCFAGLKAEEIFTGRPPDPDSPDMDPEEPGSDYNIAVELISRLAPPGEKRDALADKTLSRAEKILRERWADVCALAEALLAQETLDGEQVEAILKGASTP